MQEPRTAGWKAASGSIHEFLISVSELVTMAEILCLLCGAPIHPILCFAETDLWHIKSIKTKSPHINYDSGVRNV